MEYIGKAVKYQHRVATGHATLKPVGSGVRHHVPVPTKLETHDALVLLSYPHDKAEQQRISSEIEARRAAALAQVQNLYDHDRLEADTPETRAKLEEKFKQAKKEIEAAHQKEVAENAEAQAKVPPRVSLLYATGKPMDGADYQNSVAVAHDVPHRGHEDAAGGRFWFGADEPQPKSAGTDDEEASTGPELVGEVSDQPTGEGAQENALSPTLDHLSDMSKAERKSELDDMSRLELVAVAEQHEVQITDAMNKGEIISAIKKKLNKEDAA
jgi:hypothetical protein